MFKNRNCFPKISSFLEGMVFSWGDGVREGEDIPSFGALCLYLLCRLLFAHGDQHLSTVRSREGSGRLGGLLLCSFGPRRGKNGRPWLMAGRKKERARACSPAPA